jgi:hypothetical protein
MYEGGGSNVAQQLYTSKLSAAYRRAHLYDPNVWLIRDPEAEEKMLRDPDIAHAVGKRREDIAGRQWMIQPKDKDAPNAKMAIRVATDLVGCIKRFTSAREALARAFFSGTRYAYIHGECRKESFGDGKPRTWWVPCRLEDFDKRMFRVSRSLDANENYSHFWERFDVEENRWLPMSRATARNLIRHVYQEDQATLYHGRALMESLGWAWYAKTSIAQEALNAGERFGQGIIAAKVHGLRDAATGKPNTELLNEWLDAVDTMRSRHALVMDSDDSIEHVALNSAGWELLEQLDKKYQACVFTRVLGANLTTAATEGGSYALAEVQENSTASRIQFDREILEETLSDHLIGAIWHHNYANMVELGIATTRPLFAIKQEKVHDPMVRAQVAATLISNGVSIAEEELREQTGFRTPEPGEPIIEGRAPQQQPGMGDDPMGGFGMGMRFAGGKYEEEKHDRDKDGKFAPKDEAKEEKPDDKKKDAPKKEAKPKKKPKPKEEKKEEDKPKKSDAEVKAPLIRSQYAHDIYEGKSDEYVVAHDAWTNSASKDEQKAILEWTRSGYGRVRAIQLGDSPDTPPPLGVTLQELSQIDGALARCPNNEGTFARGMSITKSDFDRIASSGSVLELAAHSSWTTDMDTASMFASQAREDDGRKIRVLLTAEASTMKQISSLSQYHEEKESIGMRGTRYEVVGVEENKEIKDKFGTRVMNVRLREIGKDRGPDARFKR